MRAGSPLLDLYSPEILATQEELLGALASLARLGDAADPAVRESAESIVASARRRLALFDVPGDVIAAIEREGRARRAVTLTAPRAAT